MFWGPPVPPFMKNCFFHPEDFGAGADACGMTVNRVRLKITEISLIVTHLMLGLVMGVPGLVTPQAGLLARDPLMHW